MKHCLIAVLVLACQVSIAVAEDYDPFKPASYEERAAVQSAYEAFAQRHPVLKVYPSSIEGLSSISFTIQGFDCIAARKYDRSDVGEVTCYISAGRNGYTYHENQNGQLVRGRYLAPFTNHIPAAAKQCVYSDRLITYYAECGSGRSAHRH